MSIKRELRHSSRRAIEQLLALRDEAKLKIHLLGMDARRALDELEGRISTLEQRAASEGDQAADSLKAAAHELTRAMSDFMATHVTSSLGLLTSAQTLMSTAVRTCRADESLNVAAQAMWESDCGVVPVVSEGRLVGILTDRDICMATYTQGRAPAELAVEGAMSKQIISCSPYDSLGLALELMTEHRVRRLPVVAPDGELVGVLSLADIARWARPLGNAAVDGAIAETLGAICERPPLRVAAAAE